MSLRKKDRSFRRDLETPKNIILFGPLATRSDVHGLLQILQMVQFIEIHPKTYWCTRLSGQREEIYDEIHLNSYM